ncbi:MAG: M23 family metallopeptidase [Clostridia bacterium]|nr:M23 family metallopeptidase [Clostridia bacterium]
MKYREQKFAKFIGSTGFFAILACCVLIIGAATFFAVSKFNEANTEINNEPKGNESYSNIESSYNDIKEDISSAASEITEEVKGNASSEPYESEESKPQPKEQSFTLPCEGEISKDYSTTELVYSATFSDMRLHTGLDIACEKGTDVWSMSDGEVMSVEENASLGTVVAVSYENQIIIKYCGLENVTVAAGDVIAAGEVIGEVGEVPSECADQSHIHIEASKNGKSISPKDLVKTK